MPWQRDKTALISAGHRSFISNRFDFQSPVVHIQPTLLLLWEQRQIQQLCKNLFLSPNSGCGLRCCFQVCQQAALKRMNGKAGSDSRDGFWDAMHGRNEGLTENLGEEGENRTVGKYFILQAYFKICLSLFWRSITHSRCGFIAQMCPSLTHRVQAMCLCCSIHSQSFTASLISALELGWLRKQETSLSLNITLIIYPKIKKIWVREKYHGFGVTI